MGLFPNNQNPEVKLLTLKVPFTVTLFIIFICGIMDTKHQPKIYWKRDRSVVFYLVWGRLNDVDINQKSANSKNVPTEFSFCSE